MGDRVRARVHRKACSFTERHHLFSQSFLMKKQKKKVLLPASVSELSVLSARHCFERDLKTFQKDTVGFRRINNPENREET